MRIKDKKRKLTNKDKETIKKELNSCFGDVVYLECDGYIVAAITLKISEMKLGVNVYVDNYFKGKWLDVEKKYEEGKRFYPLHKKRIISKKDAKVLGLKESDCVIEYRKPWFSTSTAFINHICRHNESVRLINRHQAKRLIENKKDNGNAN